MAFDELPLLPLLEGNSDTSILDTPLLLEPALSLPRLPSLNGAPLFTAGSDAVMAFGRVDMASPTSPFSDASPISPGAVTSSAPSSPGSAPVSPAVPAPSFMFAQPPHVQVQLQYHVMQQQSAASFSGAMPALPALQPGRPATAAPSATATALSSSSVGGKRGRGQKRSRSEEELNESTGKGRARSAEEELDEEDEKLNRRERNKQSASNYRKRRKVYVEGLEAKVTSLSGTIEAQKSAMASMATENQLLKEQLDFFKRLVASTGISFPGMALAAPPATATAAAAAASAQRPRGGRMATVAFAMIACVLLALTPVVPLPDAPTGHRSRSLLSNVHLPPEPGCLPSHTSLLAYAWDWITAKPAPPLLNAQSQPQQHAPAPADLKDDGNESSEQPLVAPLPDVDSNMGELESQPGKSRAASASANRGGDVRIGNQQDSREL